MRLALLFVIYTFEASKRCQVSLVVKYKKPGISELAPLGILVPAQRRPLYRPVIFRSKLVSMEDN